MAATVEGDLALSATHFTRGPFNAGVVFGCDEEQKLHYIKRMGKSAGSSVHPMFLPGIFIEEDRARLCKAIDKILDVFTLQAVHTTSKDGLLTNMDNSKMLSFLQVSFQSQDLSNTLKSSRRQIVKMIAETGRTADRAPRRSRCDTCRLDITAVDKDQKLTGELIKYRLREILGEYSDRINECGMVVSNMSLTMQTVRLSDFQSLSPCWPIR